MTLARLYKRSPTARQAEHPRHPKLKARNSEQRRAEAALKRACVTAALEQFCDEQLIVGRCVRIVNSCEFAEEGVTQGDKVLGSASATIKRHDYPPAISI